MRVLVKCNRYDDNRIKVYLRKRDGELYGLGAELRTAGIAIPDNQDFILIRRANGDNNPYIFIRLDLNPEEDIETDNSEMIRINKTISELCVNSVVFGREGQDKTVVADLSDYIKELSDRVKQLLDNGKLYLLMKHENSHGYDENGLRDDAPQERYGGADDANERNQIEEIECNDYYCLRHAGVYTAVYYEMFRTFVERVTNDNRRVALHVLSIGCGSKTDALGLKFAKEEFRNNVVDIQYVGIDMGNWNLSNYFLQLNNKDIYKKINIIEEEIAYLNSPEYQQTLSIQEHDGIDVIYVVVFPNSISEFNHHIEGQEDYEDFRRLLDCIRNVYDGKNYYILLSKGAGEEGAVDNETIEIMENELNPKIKFSMKNGKIVIDDTEEIDYSEIDDPEIDDEEIDEYIQLQDEWIEAHREELEDWNTNEELRNQLEEIWNQELEQEQQEMEQQQQEVIDRIQKVFGNRWRLGNSISTFLYKELWDNLLIDDNTEKTAEWIEASKNLYDPRAENPEPEMIYREDVDCYFNEMCERIRERSTRPTYLRNPISKWVRFRNFNIYKVERGQQ